MNEVKKWVEDNFDLDAVQLEPFPAMPQGVRVTDKQGKEMVVYYDFLTNEVKTMFPKEGLK